MQGTQRLVVLNVGAQLFLLRLLLQAAVGAGSKLLLELVDPPSRIDVFQLAGVKGMALAANVDLQLGTHATRLEGVSTAARDRRFLVFGMNIGFHVFYFRSPV